jgi:hypothetical protein
VWYAGCSVSSIEGNTLVFKWVNVSLTGGMHFMVQVLLWPLLGRVNIGQRKVYIANVDPRSQMIPEPAEHYMGSPPLPVTLPWSCSFADLFPVAGVTASRMFRLDGSEVFEVTSRSAASLCAPPSGPSSRSSACSRPTPRSTSRGSACPSTRVEAAPAGRAAEPSLQVRQSRLA